MWAAKRRRHAEDVSVALEGRDLHAGNQQQAAEIGLQGTQLLATLFDGITRHSPEGRWFKEFAEQHGFHAAVEWRDSGRLIPEGGAPVE